MLPSVSKTILQLFLLIITTGSIAQNFKQINIVIEQDSINKLERNPFSNEDVIGDFHSDNHRIEEVDIHYRGSWYLQSLIRSSSFLRNWKIKTSKTNKYEGHREWNFNYENHIKQILAYQLMNEAKVPCVTPENVILAINGVKHGLFLKYEDPDNKTWLLEKFGDDEGDLFKAATDNPIEPLKYFADLSYLGNQDSDYYKHYRKQTNKKNGKEFDYSSLRNFLNFVNNSSDRDFENQIETHFEVETFLNYLVVSNFTSNWDSYPFRPKNFFLYNNPKDNKWHYIPWDLDGTFERKYFPSAKNYMGDDASAFHYLDRREYYDYAYREPLNRPLAWRILKIQKFRYKYIKKYKEALNSFLKVSNIEEKISKLQSKINHNVKGYPRSRTDSVSVLSNVYQIRDFISKKHQNLTDELKNYNVASVTEINNLPQVAVFPNPTQNEVHIDFPGNYNSNILSIKIYNALGKIVFQQNTKFTKNSFNIDLKNIDGGTYYLSIETDHHSFRKKLVKR